MALDDTSLVNEIDEIVNAGPTATHAEWTVQIILPDNKGTVIPFRMTGMDWNRDYDANYCDEIVVDLVLGIGTFQQLIIPNATNLTIALTKTAMVEGGGALNQAIPAQTQTFRGTLLKQASGTVAGNSTYMTTLNEGNLMGMGIVRFQLVDLAIEQTRMQSLGTILRKTTIGDAIKYLVTKIAQGLKVDSAHQIKGVDMVEPNNTVVYDHVVVEQGTKAVDVPRYIAHHAGAPYSAGFGAYLQDSIWYLYPLFDLTLFDKAKGRTLTVLNIPKNRMPQTERTFRTTSNQVIVLATEETRHADISEALQLSIGNGARYADAKQTMQGFVTVKDNKATALRVQNANEYVAGSRPNGNNNVQLSNAKITSNTFNEMSKLAPRLGSLLVITWVNSDPTLIYPGMPCKYVYEVSGQLFELKGQVIKTQTQYASTRPGIFPDVAHRSTTALTMFVEKVLDWNTDSQNAAEVNTI